MKLVTLRDKDGKVLDKAFLGSIAKGAGRDFILKWFGKFPDSRFIETNVRRYTFIQVWQGEKGKMI